MSAEAKAAQDQFAYQKFYDDAYQDPAVWDQYLKLPRWVDLRVVAAEFKKINPIDVVFLSMLKSGRFDTSKSGWEVDLMLGDIWNEMMLIVNSAWHIEDFESPDDVKMLIEAGTAMMFELFKVRAEIDAYNKELAEQEAAAGQQEQAQAETATETVIEEYVIEEPVVYYDAWWDPFYVSPLWYAPLWVVVDF